MLQILEMQILASWCMPLWELLSQSPNLLSAPSKPEESPPYQKVLTRSCCSCPWEECFGTQLPTYLGHDQTLGKSPNPKEENATKTTPCLKGGNVWKYT